MKYFIGNWKMFGVPKSINILNKINRFKAKDKNKKNIKLLLHHRIPLLETFSKNFKIKGSL